MALWYVESRMIGTLVEARTEKAALREVVTELGSRSGPFSIRKATKTDIQWQAAMGGWVPEKYRTANSGLAT